MLKYEKLSDEISCKIESDRKKVFMSDVAFDENNVIRRYNDRDMLKNII